MTMSVISRTPGDESREELLEVVVVDDIVDRVAAARAICLLRDNSY